MLSWRFNHPPIQPVPAMSPEPDRPPKVAIVRASAIDGGGVPAAEAASMHCISGYEALVRFFTPRTVGVANRLGTVADARCRYRCPATVRPARCRPSDGARRSQRTPVLCP
ncbi:hypothetical protein CHT98_32590 (plasmid) [Azospirillum brasilense]|uniref:Uncharacterized protein n=1 Tax=Azospirillum brasilense TaxID=192 RepID=A0A235H2X2_AZOBR|nr:hypothetical protein CHT98_32590 [Azospirillum brasilense]